MIEFKGSHFQREVILWAIRWYVAYPMSYRQLEEMLEERGVDVAHSTLNRWVMKYVPQLDQQFRARKRPVGASWRLDETYVKVKGNWKYLYRAVDKAGATVDFMLTAKRDRKAALRFLRKAIGQHGIREKVTIDKSGANTAAIETYNAEHETEIEIRRVKHLNNIVEPAIGAFMFSQSVSSSTNSGEQIETASLTYLDHTTVEALQSVINSIGADRTDSYQICAAYYATAARKGGGYFCTRDRLVIWCIHPHRENEVIIFPELSSHGGFLLTIRLLHMRIFTNKTITLGRFTDEQYKDLLSDSSSYGGLLSCAFSDPLMDWNYPAHILSTCVVSALAGIQFQKVRNKFRRAASLVTSDTQTCSNSMSAAINIVFESWNRRMMFNDQADLMNIQHYYTSISRITHNAGTLRGLLFRHVTSNDIVGITLWSRPNLNTANLYVNICDPNINGLSDYQIVCTSRHIEADGVTFLNVGGSESQTLDAYKRKFQPHTSVAMVSVKLTRIHANEMLAHKEGRGIA